MSLVTALRGPSGTDPGRTRAGRRAGIAAAVVALAAVSSAPLVAAPASASAASGSAPAPAVLVPRTAGTDPAPGAGTVSFGIRTAGAADVDDRGIWDYKDVVPGRTFIDHVGVVNISATPVTLRVYAADLYNNADGAVDVLAPGQPSADLGTWVALGRKEVTVPARSTVIMPFAVTVPTNAQPGDHSAAIVASFLSTAKDAKGNAIQVDNRTGQRIYLRVKGPLKPGLVVEGLTVGYRQGNPIGGGESDVRFTVRNTGNVRVSGTPGVRVDGLITDSTVKGLKNLPELLPGNSATITATAKGLFPFDRDQAKVVVDPKSAVSAADPQFQQVSAVRSFWAVSWFPVLVLILLLAFGVTFALLRRRGQGPHRGGGADLGDEDDLAGYDPVGDDRRPALTERRVLRRPQLALVLALALTSAVAALGAGPARADSGDGTLTFLPAKGLATTPMYVVTSGPCPSQAVAFFGYVSGGNFPKETVAIAFDTSGAMRYDVPFGTPLSNTLPMIAAQRGVALVPGDYTITLMCTDVDTVKVFRTFTGRITVAADLSWSGQAPAQPPAYGVPLSILSVAYPQVQASLAAEARTASGQASPGAAAGSAGAAGASGAAGAAGASAAPAGAGQAAGAAPGSSAPQVLGGPQESVPLSATPAGTTAAPDAGSGTDPLYVVGGLGVVLIAALAGLRRWVSRSPAPSAAGAEPDWDELDEPSGWDHDGDEDDIDGEHDSDDVDEGEDDGLPVGVEEQAGSGRT